MDDNLLIEKLLRELPKSYFETHQWDHDTAFSNFTAYNEAEATESHVFIPNVQQILDARIRYSNFPIDIPVSSLSPLDVSLANNFFTLLDISGTHSDSEETQEQEYYNGGTQSGTIVQYPKERMSLDFPESPQPRTPFHGVGRTVAEPDCVSTEPPISSDSLTTTLPPSVDLVLDPAAPTTLIHFRLADGTRLVSRFNTHHTVRDVRGFIDAYRPGGSKDYQLLIMGCPPKPLPDFDQTLENAGIYNCVIIQKF